MDLNNGKALMRHAIEEDAYKLLRCGIRELIREQYSQIDALESLDGLHDIRLMRVEIGSMHSMVDEPNGIGIHNYVSYDAIASAEFFKDPTNGLIINGVVSEEDIHSHKSIGENQTNGFHDYSLYITNDNSHLVTRLRIYGPDYIK